MDELALLTLTPAQLRVFLAMRHLESRWGEVRASMEQLAELTGYSRSSIHRAVEGLVEAEFIKVTRTKRNFGMLSENRYRLLRCSTRDTSAVKISDDGRVISDTSTSVLITTKTTKSTKTTSKSNNSIPSELKGADAPKEENVVNRWKDDDDIGGFGLLEGETSGSATPAQKAKQHRSERPVEQWTAQMMASEFSSRVYAKIRGIPGLVNGKRLAIALATNRKNFGVTAAQEYAAMEKFFGDERNLTAIKRSPKNAHGIFLNAITKFIADNKNFISGVDETVEGQYVYASDGRQFEDSAAGRAFLAAYENKLKGQK